MWTLDAEVAGSIPGRIKLLNELIFLDSGLGVLGNVFKEVTTPILIK